MNKGSISIYIDNKAKKNKSNPINIPSRKPSIWIPNNKITKCFKCRTEFGFLVRKHHCRVCGRIFCNDCSKWVCKKYDFIIPASPPNTIYKYISSYITDTNKIRVCFDCNIESNTAMQHYTELIIFSNLPLTIEKILSLRTISKKWCKIINYIIRIYRSSQYKIPSQYFSKIEKRFLWIHRYEFKNHFTWISKCLNANSDRTIDEISEYMNYLLTTKKTYSCKNLLCRSNCKKKCKPEDILEIGFFLDLSKHLSAEKFLINCLNNNKSYYKLLMPWLVELSRKYLELALDLAFKCVIEHNLFYQFYFETKYYLNTLDDIDNKNLKKIMTKINTHSDKQLLDNVRKTDQFIKLIKLMLSKNNFNHMINLKDEWFKQNGPVILPWDINTFCYDIDVNKIRHINSSSNPWIIPLLTKRHDTSKKYTFIIIKNMDLRKDKLTMYVSIWLNKICENDIYINTYNILPYDNSYGWIEMMEDTVTLYDINYKHRSNLKDYIKNNNPNNTMLDFIKTCASSCILCYLLGIGDRHSENILVNKYGELVHIDFSYLLGDDPKNVSVEMKITDDMLKILQGKESRYFKSLIYLCSGLYKKIRSRSSLWYMLLTYLAFNKPEIENYYDNYDFIKEYIINRLVPGEFDDEGTMHMIKIVERSSDQSWSEKLSDMSHNLANNLKSIGSYIPQFKM